MSIYKVYCRSKAHKQWKPYSQPFINLENAEKCKVKCESRKICDVHGNLIEYKVMEETQIKGIFYRRNEDGFSNYREEWKTV